MRRGAGFDAVRFEDLPHGGRGETMAEADELAVDTPIPHVEFAVAISTTSRRISIAAEGRPVGAAAASSGGPRDAGANATTCRE